MPIKDFEDKRLEDQKKEKESDPLASGQHINRPNKKLLLGTVQFYEDILTSINKSFIVVFNNHGKHIEAWGNLEYEEEPLLSCSVILTITYCRDQALTTLTDHIHFTRTIL